VLSVESFPQPFPETGFLGVGGDHPTPCNRLEKALGQTDLPSEGQGHKKGEETFHLSCLTPIHRGGQFFEERELRSKKGLRIVC
jgi:hypothetical protein